MEKEVEWSLTMGHLQAVEELSALEDGYEDRFPSPTEVMVDVESLLASMSGRYAPSFRSTAVAYTGGRQLASTVELLSKLPTESAGVSAVLCSFLSCAPFISCLP